VERGRVDPRRLQPLRELPRPEPGVEQHARPPALDERRVALAPGSEQAEAQAHTVSSELLGRQPLRLPRTLAARRPLKTAPATRRTSSALTASTLFKISPS